MQDVAVRIEAAATAVFARDMSTSLEATEHRADRRSTIAHRRVWPVEHRRAPDRRRRMRRVASKPEPTRRLVLDPTAERPRRKSLRPTRQIPLSGALARPVLHLLS